MWGDLAFKPTNDRRGHAHPRNRIAERAEIESLVSLQIFVHVPAPRGASAGRLLPWIWTRDLKPVWREVALNAFRAAAVAIVSASLGACAMPTDVPAEDPVAEQLSGKTIARSGTTITLQPNGALVGSSPDGTEISGAWAVRDGRFCRTLATPESIAGTSCQGVEITGKTVVFNGNVWTIG